MKAKLNKVDNGYVLLVDNIMYATDNDKLSKQNCDEIFGVVDVEKLACKEIKIDIDTYKDIHKKATEKNASPCIPSREGGCVGANLYSQVNGFIKGYNKAMELNKEKLFTLEDVRNTMDWIMTQYFEFYEQPTTGRREQYLESIQQPTEIEVEVEYMFSVEENGESTNTGLPKLDENGNLILKKL